ncbi:N-acetylmuramoyl-L-alanine amidase [bacterium]|nr:N-acetylmuramoyl-L-alanine amidase [bacterium]
MIKKIFCILLYLIFVIPTVSAKIDVVYPTSKEITVNSDCMFFVGNTDKGAYFTVNSKPVKLWEDNFFVHVAPLEYGRNEIKFRSEINGVVDETVYVVKRNKVNLSYTGSANSSYEKINTDGYMYTKTINDNSTVREKPSSSANRLVELQKGIPLYLEGKKGDYYKIAYTGDTQFWIHKSNVQTPVKIIEKQQPMLRAQRYYSNEMYDFATFHLTEPVMYTLTHQNNTIELTLYGINSQDENGNITPNYKYKFTRNKNFLGYDCSYQDNDLTCRLAKLPENNTSNPLNGLTIFIDAGHGGNEKGSVGPTRVYEKDINLSISKYLTEELKNSGVNVITSRTDDTQVKLYDRVDIAKKNNALISLSIHANALPNGKNPYLLHGTEVHYYNENAKALAEIIKNNLSHDLNLRDNGIHRSSFALDRATNPVSVLVEVAYMIHPEEYILLKNPEFQRNVAKSIRKSIEQYIGMLKN